MTLTSDERTLLGYYRRLTDFDRGYVDAMIEGMARRDHDERKKGWQVHRGALVDVKPGAAPAEKIEGRSSH